MGISAYPSAVGSPFISSDPRRNASTPRRAARVTLKNKISHGFLAARTRRRARLADRIRPARKALRYLVIVHEIACRTEFQLQVEKKGEKRPRSWQGRRIFCVPNGPFLERHAARMRTGGKGSGFCANFALAGFFSSCLGVVSCAAVG